jgi:hypothetical protein
MTNLISKKTCWIAAGLLATALAAGLNAQTSTMRANIPFQFIAGDEVFPAGRYTVNVDERFHLIQLLPSHDARTYPILLSIVSSQRKKDESALGALKFVKRDQLFVLNAVWRPGEIDGHPLYVPKAGRELARETPGGELTTIKLVAR